ncbi:hypothetical protein A2761_00170 [Candidatus Kaiserbacteria bacterium RIFCSPHIGHO2_01_FULL_51_33]|uniref:Uncharacterized protein n=1 Tax=Candidatus Kaiserbacteria bacterium RIFCSPLOWO2_01_FULL_51_21 TaxID=1798508 RepID=A0A1F6EDU6_9BACT|nr:MAG: hypothetical protein A2761_00170 [Candidatus Kaiserbacteria bacterium RIFCSPHIGHO2_01_FULL_51_33]OGG71849.1 MAG: hypothetical protein A3A35_02825 [Candidatus Kaiserbacteria bacterium RIFCSPLOWO2_01_FULL_51_21]
MSWAGRRKTIYTGGVLGVFLIIAAAAYFLIFYQAPSCSDLVQNGTETGIDCGGSCEKVCAAEAIPPAVIWSRSFEIAPGIWTAVAYVENKNVDAGTRTLPYRFKLFEEGGVLIAERNGSTFLVPHEAAIIVEPNIAVGKRMPIRTQFEFETVPLWEGVSEKTIPKFNVRSAVLEHADTLPRVTVMVSNSSNSTVKEVEASVLLFDAEENVIAASKTIIQSLLRGETEQVVFTWPKPFLEEASRVDVRVRAPFGIDEL